MSWLEALMLICFGLSWPMSIWKALRTKTVAGKCPIYMAIVCVGYFSGILHKLVYNLDWIVFLYALNMGMVALDLSLYLHYSRRDRDALEPVLP
jgi:hypothetical protein